MAGELSTTRRGNVLRRIRPRALRCRSCRKGDFAPGLSFAATVLADVAVASGQLDEAQALLDLLPQGSLPPGVGTVLIPAGRGRLRLSQHMVDLMMW